MTQRLLYALCAVFAAVAALPASAQAPPIILSQAPSQSPTGTPPPQIPGSRAASAIGPRLSLQQAVDRALANNPTLIAAREHVSATRATEVTASLRQNPTLTLLGQDVTLPADNPGNPYFYSANVSRLFERGQKRRWRIDSATATTDQTESQMHDTERQVVVQVRQAFTNMLIARGALGIAEENLRDFRKTLDLSQARLDAGDIPRNDFERIDLQLAQFESDFDTAELNLHQASAQLQLLFGVERPDLTLELDGKLDPPAIALTRDEAVTKALAARPDLAAASQGLRAAQANARYAIAGGTSDPTLAGEFERSGNDTTFGASLAIPLRIFDRNQGEKERTRFEIRSGQFALTAARNQVINDIDQAWLAYEVAGRLANRYNTHYLAEAARVRDNLQFSYRNGNATLLDYLSALRDYRAINLASLTANGQVWLAIHQLSFATATDILP